MVTLKKEVLLPLLFDLETFDILFKQPVNGVAALLDNVTCEEQLRVIWKVLNDMEVQPLVLHMENLTFDLIAAKISKVMQGDMERVSEVHIQEGKLSSRQMKLIEQLMSVYSFAFRLIFNVFNSKYQSFFERLQDTLTLHSQPLCQSLDVKLSLILATYCHQLLLNFVEEKKRCEGDHVMIDVEILTTIDAILTLYSVSSEREMFLEQYSTL
jgi:hypothetical protein